MHPGGDPKDRCVKRVCPHQLKERERVSVCVHDHLLQRQTSTQSIHAHTSNTGLQEGVVTVISRHTTTAIAINEDEARLFDDIRQVREQGWRAREAHYDLRMICMTHKPLF